MKLKTYMTENNLSQSDLARQLNMTQAAVSMWVSGERRPDWDSLAKLAHLTGGAVTANDFMPVPESAAPAQEAAQ